MKNCAIIPAYNEEKTIKEVVERVKESKLLPIVVNDRSHDETSRMARETGAVVIDLDRNVGKGEALKAGIEYVSKEMLNIENIIFIDADLQYFPEESERLLEPLRNGEADMVMGFRDWSTVPFRHKLGNFVWRNSFNILFGTKLLDTNCGFMAISRSAIEIAKESLQGGYIIENSLLSHAVKNNLRIKQVPVTVSYNHKSKVPRGVRMVSGITFFILKEGMKYRLSGK